MIFTSPAIRSSGWPRHSAGLKQLYRYYSHIRANLSYPLVDRKGISQDQITIGGGAFTAFADQLIGKLPEGPLEFWRGEARF